MKRWFCLIAFAILSLSSVWRWKHRYHRGYLRITAFDVGQGDSLLVEFPGKQTWLIDSGNGFGSWNTGSRDLVPELARLGILHLDTAFLSHPDADHAAGFEGILNHLSVGEFWMSQATRRSGNPLLNRLVRLAEQAHTSVRTFASNWRTHIENVEVQVLPINAGPTTNDEALLLRLDFAGCSVFFAADAEALSERRIVHGGVNAVDLLKVGHHGSRTSSTPEFLHKLDPHWAIISVGAGNTYGHPHPLVLRRLHHRGTSIFRTDFHGFVQFTFLPTGEAICESAMGDCGRQRCRGSSPSLPPFRPVSTPTPSSAFLAR